MFSARRAAGLSAVCEGLEGWHVLVGMGKRGNLCGDPPGGRRERGVVEQAFDRPRDRHGVALIFFEGERRAGTGKCIGVVPHVGAHRDAELREATCCSGEHRSCAAMRDEGRDVFENEGLRDVSLDANVGWDRSDLRRIDLGTGGRDRVNIQGGEGGQDLAPFRGT